MHPADQAMSLGFAKAQEVVNELAQTFQTFKSNYYPVLLTHPPDSRDSRIQELHALQKRLLQYVESANVLLQSARELKDQISYHHDTCVSARSYISALPVEVMRDILRFAILGHYNPLRSAAAFSTVCRRWRDIVLSEKDMWSSLTIHDVGRVSSNAIGRFATRSHPHPFHLKLDETWIPIFSLKTAFETPFVDNLRSVTWNLSDNFYKFLEALNEDDGSCHVLPNVQIVSIQGAHDCPTCWRRMGYDYLLENRAEWALELYFPALTSLSLDRVTCVLEVPVISRLEHLSLLSVPFEEDTCDVIFRHGSKLKTLEISWLSNLDMDIRGATPSSAARWPLQHLQQLKLGQVPVHLASFFMASIDTPELEKLTLYANLVTRAEHRELAITNLASALRHTVKFGCSLLRQKTFPDFSLTRYRALRAFIRSTSMDAPMCLCLAALSFVYMHSKSKTSGSAPHRSPSSLSSLCLRLRYLLSHISCNYLESDYICGRMILQDIRCWNAWRFRHVWSPNSQMPTRPSRESSFPFPCTLLGVHTVRTKLRDGSALGDLMVLSLSKAQILLSRDIVPGYSAFCITTCRGVPIGVSGVNNEPCSKGRSSTGRQFL
ncbi:hypothetical protein DL93DRAFT_2076207 [Clavulina sp. PMI_390]|nr:hypothetical protein DL93DRAFT_2076207 [Clavulina sp. PMI_390]